VKGNICDIFIIRRLLQRVMSISKEELESLVDKSFKELQINGQAKENIHRLLGVIEIKDTNTYLHQLRTGLVAPAIAIALGKQAKPLGYAGVLHDIGKLTIDNGTLTKLDSFDHMDVEHMKAHVLNGYRILKGIHDFSAEMLLWHHYFKPHDPYPTEKELKELQSNLPARLKRQAKEYGLYLAFADVYDALVTRDNSVYGRKLRPEETQPEMLKAFPKYTKLINKLYKKGVLGRNYDDFFKTIEKYGLKKGVEKISSSRYAAISAARTAPQPADGQKHR
jgi:hypothetical protein